MKEKDMGAATTETATLVRVYYGSWQNGIASFDKPRCLVWWIFFECDLLDLEAETVRMLAEVVFDLGEHTTVSCLPVRVVWVTGE